MTGGCRATWVGSELRLRIDGEELVFKPFDGGDVDIDALREALFQYGLARCGATLECYEHAKQVVDECVEAAEEAVNRRLLAGFDPLYGLGAAEFFVDKLLYATSVERPVVLQAGYMVVLPPGVRPSVLRDPEAEIEVDGVRVKVGELLRRLGVDPSRPYRLMRLPWGRVYVYLTMDARFLVTTQWVPPGSVTRLFVHAKGQSLDDVAGRLARRGVEIKTSVVYPRAAARLKVKRDEVADLEAVYAEPYAPLSMLKEVAARVEEAFGETGQLSVDPLLLAAYMAVAAGGHVEHAVPHALIVTPPATGKTLMGERFCAYVFSELTEASILGGANVAKGTTFTSILEGRHACVQVEHAEGLRSQIIKELLTLMGSSRAARGVLGNALEARVYSPIVFTGNVTGNDPLNEAVTIVSILSMNAAAAGRRFGIILMTSNVRRWEPSRDEVEILSRLGLVKYIVENPVVHSKLARAYRLIMDEVAYAPPEPPKPTGSEILDRFIGEFYRNAAQRVIHAALNILVVKNIAMIVNGTVDDVYDVLSSELDIALKVMDELYKATIVFVTRGKPSDFDSLLVTLPKYVATAVTDIVALAEQSLSNGQNHVIVRFSMVYDRARYKRNSRRRIVALIARYGVEFREAIDAWARSRGCTASVRLGEDDVEVEVVCGGGG